MSIVPVTTRSAINYSPKRPFLSDLLCRSLSLMGHAAHIILGVLRIFFPIPPEYGACKSRQMVYCRVINGGVNPVDAKRLYGDKLPHWCLSLVEMVVEGRVCGIDFSGEVIDAPPDSGFKPGDAVFGTMPPFVGAYCEFVLAPTDSISFKPKNLSHAEASVLPLVGLTALQALEDCGICPGVHVLVLGASGGTGHVAVQIARAKRAGCVTAVCGSRNRDFVRELGADEVVCYDDKDVIRAGGVVEVLSEIVGRRGEVDIVFDSVSSHDPRDRKCSYEHQIRSRKGADRVLSRRGIYLMLGGLWYDWLKAHILRFLGLNLFGDDRRLFWVRFPNSSEYLRKLSFYSESDALKVAVSERFPFTEHGLQDAFEKIMTRRTTGKLTIDIAE